MARSAILLSLLDDAWRLDRLNELKETRRRNKIRSLRERYKMRNSCLLSTDASFIKMFMLTEELISDLTKDLEPHLPNEEISYRTQILCALSFLAKGRCQKIVRTCINKHISPSSASAAIKAVVLALNKPEVVKKYIKFPQNAEERLALQQKFLQKYKIPGVIGCIDGTVITMIKPKSHETLYYCKKGYFGTNVLIIADPDFNILHVDASFGGATDEDFIFYTSDMSIHLEQLNEKGERVCLLGDSEFAQKSHIMTPFKNSTDDSPEEYYNEIHSTAMDTVAKTLNILKSRFRYLLTHRIKRHDPAMIAKIIIACCVLHNICNRAGLPAPPLSRRQQRDDAYVLSLLQRNRRPCTLDTMDPGRQDLVNILWNEREA